MTDPYETMISDESCLAMRVASGRVDTEDKLVVFLYLLGRDNLPLGEIEGLIDKIQRTDEDWPCHFTNGWLASWAAYTASKIRDGEAW